MNIVVIGQRGDGRVYKRTVTPAEFIEGWGRYAEWLWDHARAQTAIVGNIKIRVVLTA